MAAMEETLDKASATFNGRMREARRLSRLARPAESPQGSEGIRVLQVWKKQYFDSLGLVSMLEILRKPGNHYI